MKCKGTRDRRRSQMLHDLTKVMAVPQWSEQLKKWRDGDTVEWCRKPRLLLDIKVVGKEVVSVTVWFVIMHVTLILSQHITSFIAVITLTTTEHLSSSSSNLFQAYAVYIVYTEYTQNKNTENKKTHRKVKHRILCLLAVIIFIVSMDKVDGISHCSGDC